MAKANEMIEKETILEFLRHYRVLLEVIDNVELIKLNSKAVNFVEDYPRVKKIIREFKKEKYIILESLDEFTTLPKG